MNSTVVEKSFRELKWSRGSQSELQSTTIESRVVINYCVFVETVNSQRSIITVLKEESSSVDASRHYQELKI